jgi:expansin (peptidoglycan-binding protein)
MKLLSFLSITVVITQVIGQETFTGDATVYGGNANGGTCGFQRSWRGWSSTSIKFTAALNTPQWDSSLNCGRCAKVQYQSNPPIIVQIVDKCPECKKGDLDFAPDAYAAITKKGPGREKITWSWVECSSDFVQGNLEIVLKEGSNPYWVAFQPQNFKIGVNKLEIRMEGQVKWKQLERNDQILPGYYFQAANVHGGFELRATAVNGQMITSRKFASIYDAMLTQSNFFGTRDAPQSRPQPQPQPQPLKPKPVKINSNVKAQPRSTPSNSQLLKPKPVTNKPINNKVEIPQQKVSHVPVSIVKNESPALTPVNGRVRSQCV